MKMIRALAIMSAAALLALGGCSSDNSGNVPVAPEPSPVVWIVAPADSTTVTESAAVTVTVENGFALRMSLFVDGSAEPVAIDSIAPFSFVWNVVGYDDGTEHQLAVQAIFSDSSMMASVPVVVTVDNSSARPPAVEFNEPTDVNSHGLTLQWQRSSAADFASYQLYMSRQPGVDNSSQPLVEFFDRDQTSLRIYQEEENSTHYYRLYVYDQSGLYSASSEFVGRTLNLPPFSEPVTTYEDVDSRSIELNWEVTVNNDFDRYEIHRAVGLSVSPDDEMIFSSSDPYATSFVDQDISTLTSYSYLLTIFDTGGLSASSNIATAELPSRAGLQALWTFDEEDGFDIVDASGHNRNATRHNGAHLVSGHTGDCLVFDGEDDYAYIPSLYNEPPENLTVSVWAAASTDTTKCLIYHAEVGEWALSVDPDDSLTCAFRFQNGQWRYFNVEIAADADWHHYAMVYTKGVGVAAYLDGDSLGMMATPDLDLWKNGTEYASSLGSFKRGCNQNNYYGGRLDEVRVYTRALSSLEIRILSEQ